MRGIPGYKRSDCLAHIGRFQNIDTLDLRLIPPESGIIPETFPYTTVSIKGRIRGNIGYNPFLRDLTLTKTRISNIILSRFLLRLCIRNDDISFNVETIGPRARELTLDGPNIFGVLKSLRDLEELDITGTQITNIGEYRNLTKLSINRNGSITTRIGRVLASLNSEISEISIQQSPTLFDYSFNDDNLFNRFSDLTLLNLEYNGLSGPIPVSLAKIPSLEILKISGNNFVRNEQFFYELGQSLVTGRRTEGLHLTVAGSFGSRCQWDGDWSIDLVMLTLAPYMESAHFDADLQITVDINFELFFERLNPRPESIWERVAKYKEAFEQSAPPLLGGRKKKNKSKRRGCRKRSSRKKSFRFSKIHQR